MNPKQRHEIAARVSTIFGPVPMGALLGLAVGIHSGRGVLAGAAWGLLSVFCAAILPALATLPLRKRQPRTRNIRLAYMSLAAAGAAIGVGLLWTCHAPSDVRVLSAGFGSGLVLSACVNVIYSSSNHVAALSGGLVLAAALLWIWVAPAVIAVALLAWSRVELGRHSLNQTIVGVAVGTLSAIVTVTFLD